MTDFGIFKFDSEVRETTGKIASMCSDNYPETMGLCCIVNTPLLFRGVWAIVKKMIDERTVAKMHVYG